MDEKMMGKMVGSGSLRKSQPRDMEDMSEDMPREVDFPRRKELFGLAESLAEKIVSSTRDHNERRLVRQMMDILTHPHP
jgi:hypothetical protein